MYSFGRFRRRCGTGLRLSLYAVACLALGAAKRVVPLPTLARVLWQDAEGPRNQRREALDVAAVLTATRWIGTRGRDCLQRSLLLYRLLSRSGADPCLIIGFRSQPSGIEGHAWVEVDGRVVGESDAALAQFTPCVGFGPHGGRYVPDRRVNYSANSTSAPSGLWPSIELPR
jgi:hypothetical protein